jgi:ABC-type Co2+ transport system permease subunit
VLTIPSLVHGDSKRALQAGHKAAPSVTRCPASTHNTQEDIMFTRIPRTGSHLRAAARLAAARPRRLAAALAAVTCALLTSAIVPAASAHELTPAPPDPAPLAPVPAPAAQVVTAGGMPGWQITLIAVAAALVTAIAAVFLDRMLAARRSASSTTA